MKVCLHFYIQYNSPLWVSSWPFQGRGTAEDFPTFAICVHHSSRCILTAQGRLSHSPHVHSLTPRCESLHDLVKNWDVRRLFYHFHMTGFSQWVPSSFTISWKKRMLPNSLTSLGSTPNMIVTHSWGNTQLRDRCRLLAILCIHSSSRGFVFTSEKTSEPEGFTCVSLSSTCNSHHQ